MNTLVMITQLVYLLITAGLCLAISLRTRRAEQLTSHQGIKRFRRVFNYLFISYLLNITRLIKPASITLLIIKITSITIIGYLSTMAILTIISIIRNKDKDYKPIAVIIAAISAITTPEVIVITQLIIFLIAFITLSNKKKLSNNNKATYSLILITWFINLFITNRVINGLLRTPLYLLTITTLTIILIRVNKRLK